MLDAARAPPIELGAPADALASTPAAAEAATADAPGADAPAADALAADALAADALAADAAAADTALDWGGVADTSDARAASSVPDSAAAVVESRPVVESSAVIPGANTVSCGAAAAGSGVTAAVVPAVTAPATAGAPSFGSSSPPPSSTLGGAGDVPFTDPGRNDGRVGAPAAAVEAGVMLPDGGNAPPLGLPPACFAASSFRPCLADT